jgi:hypothetical protein
VATNYFEDIDGDCPTIRTRWRLATGRRDRSDMRDSDLVASDLKLRAIWGRRMPTARDSGHHGEISCGAQAAGWGGGLPAACGCGCNDRRSR